MSELSKAEYQEIEKAKKHLLKARLYRLVSFCFAIIGVLLFLYFYLVYVEGRFLEALRTPSTVLILVFPFLPAAFLSWRAMRAEKKFFRMMREIKTGDSAADK